MRITKSKLSCIYVLVLVRVVVSFYSPYIPHSHNKVKIMKGSPEGSRFVMWGRIVGVLLQCFLFIMMSAQVELQARNSFIIKEIENSATFMSNAFPTYVIDSFLATFFIFKKPLASKDIETKMESLLKKLQSTDTDAIPERDVWIQSLFQFETILRMSKEKLTDSFDLSRKTGRMEGDRAKRSLAHNLIPEPNILGFILKSITGVAVPGMKVR